MTVALLTGVSPEVAREHLERHECRDTGHYERVTYRCDPHGTLAVVTQCETCGDPLLVEVQPDEHCVCVPELLDLERWA